MKIKTLQDILINAATNYPKNGIGYVHYDGDIYFQSYLELFKQSKKLLYGLTQFGIQPKDKLILALNKNEETIPLLWACISGGIIPTILQPPISFSEINPAAEKLTKVYNLLNKPKIIFSDNLYDKWDSKNISKESLLNFSSIPQSDDNIGIIKADENDIAFIQFSSGSTGAPKGIMLTHKNIITNLDAISIGMELSLKDSSVNWMPLYHDMGLFGFHFTALYKTVNQYQIDPADFIKKPFLWLDIISQKKITTTGCPNFGQSIALRHLKRKKASNWDLSHLKVIFNGAEPISVTIMNEFTKELEKFGFNPKAMMPAYGMAESTLAITFSPLLQLPTVIPFNRKELQNNNKAVKSTDDKDIETQKIVSVGKALNDIEIRIVDDNDKALEETKVGHIQIKGKSITHGYYNDPIATKKSYCGEWFRTGDLGFIFDGNLFITGRFKDIIFINGKNYYANDLENIALQIEEVNFGKIVFGGVFDEKLGHDKLILFLVGSPNKKNSNTFTKIKQLFRKTIGINIDVFIPIKSNQIPKTSSGKIQRYKLISQYLKGKFDESINKTSEIIKKSL